MSEQLDERRSALENEYFYRKEQEILARMKERLKAENAQQVEYKCPKCDGKLVEADFEGIRIDVCGECSGVWLDAHEFAHVVEKEEDKGWFGRIFG